MPAQIESDEINLSDDKPSTCYGCGQELKTYSMLVCAECLNEECAKFAKFAESKSPRRKKK